MPDAPKGLLSTGVLLGSLREKLLALDPLDPSPEARAAIEEAVQEMAGNLAEAFDIADAQAVDLRTRILAAKAAVKLYCAAVEALEGRLEFRRQIKRDAIRLAGAECVKSALCATTLVPGRTHVEVEDENAIPRAFFVTPAPVLDKKLLAKALADGMGVAGARLVEGEPTIQERWVGGKEGFEREGQRLFEAAFGTNVKENPNV